MDRCSIASRFLRTIVFDNDIVNDKYEDSLIDRIKAENQENEGRTSRRRGSIEGRIVVPRNIAQGGRNLYQDYFADPPVYDNIFFFQRRFQMNPSIVLRLQNAVENYDPYFIQKRNAAGLLCLSFLQKITAALRMLAYGVPADGVDEYLHIGESAALESLKRFVKAVVAMVGDVYLRAPNENDIKKLLAIGEKRGFPGMLGSIDCMHWRWKNCPSAWQSMYSGHFHEPTIILEAVASYNLWIWHAFFGLPGSHNDINVLDRSSVFNELAEGRALSVNYSINGSNYTMGYYLVDGIYPTWSTFVKTIPAPRGNKKKHFAAAQESARKDVERAFRVLQSRFAIVRGPACLWNEDTLKDIMTACIIMHNMIIEEEGDEKYHGPTSHNFDRTGEIPNIEPTHECTLGLMEFIQNHIRIKDRETHCRLQADLVEHLWNLHGGILFNYT